jgi:hypothetical protein
MVLMAADHQAHYESIIDPDETWLEKWLLHEATEVYAYWSCLQQETNAFIKKFGSGSSTMSWAGCILSES